MSFLAGQGTALAMIAAYVLAAELHRAGPDFASALVRYERTFGEFVRKKQNAALRMGGVFAPQSKASMWLRNQVMNVLTIPWVADLAIGRDLVDKIELPAFPPPGTEPVSP